MHRILIVGTSGAGKTTLATRIAARLALPLHTSDPFYWEPGWQPASNECIDHRLNDVMRSSEWVLDGNFERRWQEVWNQADCVVWLDYSLIRILWQVTTRNIGWTLCRKKVWPGDCMSIGRAYSGIRHAFQSHAAKRRRYSEYIRRLDSTMVYRFAIPRETDQWVAKLGAAPSATRQ